MKTPGTATESPACELQPILKQGSPLRGLEVWLLDFKGCDDNCVTAYCGRMSGEVQPREGRKAERGAWWSRDVMLGRERGVMGRRHEAKKGAWWSQDTRLSGGRGMVGVRCKARRRKVG
ncbi:hypothetical protein MHYP_G00260530 [Metynnis hypsauchen]